MIFHLTVMANRREEERAISEELAKSLSGLVDVRITQASDKKEIGPVLFVDSRLRHLEDVLHHLDRKGRAVFLVVRESECKDGEIPSAFEGELVDDILISPFRPFEVMSKIRHYQQLLLWEEVQELNSSFSEVLGKLHEDLKLAERLQKSKSPPRFPDVKGFKVESRYLAGMRAGGDYIDLAESKDGNQLSIILSDSSSYGLSSAFLSILMKVAMKLSADETRSCTETLARIHQELAVTLGERDRLSFFYGIVSRRDYRLRFLNLGTSRAFYAPPKGTFELLAVQGDAITQNSAISGRKESEIVLAPEGRLALVSDGFVEASGGEKATLRLLQEFRGKDPKDALNELTYRVKSKYSEPDDLPDQDCTAVVFDVDSRLIRAV